jgi:hypothetical protein
LIAALLAAPFAAAQAHDDAARHRAWIAAQKIDVQPTLTVKETQVPADSVNQGSSGYQQQGSQGYQQQAPSGGMAPPQDSSGSSSYGAGGNMPSHEGMGMQQGGSQMK